MKFGAFMQKWGVLIAFIVLLAVNMITQPNVFLKPENLRNLFSQNVEIGLISIGMTFLIASGGIDLSVGSLMALAGGIAVMVMNRQLDAHASESTAVAFAIIVAIGVGTLGGIINGLLVTVGKIAPFVATLGGLLIYRSLCLALADGGTINSNSALNFPYLTSAGLPLPFITAANGKPLMIQFSVFFFLGVAVVGAFLLQRTVYGRRAIAVGANEKAAVYAAVPVTAVKLTTYCLVGLCVGLAAVIGASKLNSVSSSGSGTLYELDAIAAVVIGGTSLAGGRGRIWGTVIGVLLLGMITTMLVASGISNYWQGVVKGAIILLAVLIQRGQKAG